MRVLHVIPGVARRYGGPSTAIMAMCEALEKCHGLSVEIATTDADGPGGRLARETLPPGLCVRLFPRTFSERWKYSASLGAWLRAHSKNYDLLHVHCLWSYASAAAGSAARRSRTPYVIRPAGMLSRYTWQHGGLKNATYWRLIEKRTVTGACAIHATSPEEADDARRVSPKTSSYVIPNGVEAAAFSVPLRPHALRERCGGAAKDRPIILYLSRLHPKKGITDLLLPAVARLPSDWFLAIAGGEDPHLPGYETTVRSEIDRLGLSDRVALIGEISPADRWAMFDGAAVFVLPSHSENFGIVVAEAMGRACPIVVTRAVNASEHVEAAAAGWVVDMTPDTVARGLMECLADPQAAHEAGLRGRRYAEEHLSWDAIAARIRGMYEDCVR